MIPILYKPEETNFTTNGLGLLSDALEAEVTEERNGVYQLHILYPVDGKHFSEIQEMSVIRAVPADGKQAQPFDVFRISTPIDGKVEIDARHITYRLSKNTVMPFKSTAVADALQKIKLNCVDECAFDFWTDKVSSGSMNLKTPQSVRAILGGVEGSVLDSFGGGEYEWDNTTVKLWANRGQDKGVTLRYGKNITDIRQERNIENTVTGIVPYWAGQSDTQEDILVTLEEQAVYSANAEDFPYARTVPVDFSGNFQEQPTEEQLRSRAQTYITANKIGQPAISIEVSFVPLWQTEEYKDIANLERVNLCDTVTVVFPKLHISVKAKVIKTVYDVLKGRYSSIELGDARTNLASDISKKVTQAVAGLKKEIPKTSQFIRILNEQTELITGGLGGYVKFVFNADGEPQELLFMDTDDIQTAVNVIRINRNGIGFSNNGYTPSSFRSAWTIDGKFSADFISTGHLLANYIQGGTLSLGGDDNGNGVIVVYDANGNVIGEWNKDGLSATGDLEMKKGDIWGLVGSVPYLTWLLVEGQARLDILNGFSIKKETETSLLSSHSIIPQNTRVLDQCLAPSKIIKSFVFTNDIETSGNIFYLDIDKKSFVLHPERYGTASAVTGAPEANIGEDGVSVKSGGSTIAATSNDSNDGRIRVIAPSKTTGHGSTEVDMRYTSILLHSGSNKQRINLNGKNLIFAADGAHVSLNGSNDSGAQLEIKGGKYGLKVSNSNASAMIDGSSWMTLAYTSSSSKRYKHSIKPLSEDRDSHRLLDIPVVEFEWNAEHFLQYEDMRGQTVPGIIAEDVAKIYPSAVIHNANGEVESWDERRLIPGMLALIQEQDTKIKQLEARLSKLEELLL